MVRRQLPVRSPVSAGTVLAGLRVLLASDAAPRGEVRAALCRIYAADEALLFDSGTTALTVALEATTAQASRPVALPAYSCYDLATAAIGARARVVLYDLDPATLGPDWGSVERVLALRPAALVAVHLFGYPTDLAAMARRCEQAGVLVIEDAAQGAGGWLHDKPLGAWGPLTVLSFGRGKGVTAGAGGALLVRGQGARAIRGITPRARGAARGVAEVGRVAMQWLLGRPALYGIPAALPFLRLGETLYRPPREAAEMSGAAVAMLRRSLSGAAGELDRRRSNAIRLLPAARASARVRPVEQIGGAIPGFLRLPLLSETSPAADVVRELGTRGVARAYPLPLHRLAPLADRIVNGGQQFAGAELLAERLLTFPTHGLVTAGDLQALEKWLG